MKIRGFDEKKCDPAGTDGSNLAVGAVTVTPAPAAAPETPAETVAVVESSTPTPTPAELSVEQIMAFDPFGEDGDGFLPATTDQPEGPTGEPGTPDPVVPVSGTPEVPAAAPKAVDENVAQMQGQITQLTQMLTQMQAQNGQGNPAPAAPAASDDPSVEAEAELDSLYNFNIPAELLTLFNSEEPQDQMKAFSAYGMGIAKAVHKQLTTQMSTQMETIPTVMRQTMDAQNYYKGIFDDFYGTNTDLNRAEVYPIVQQVTQQVMTASPGQKWSPELRDKIAAQVRTTIASIAGTGQAPGTAPIAPGTPPPQVPAQAVQPYAAAPGARPPVENPNSLANDIRSTLF